MEPEVLTIAPEADATMAEIDGLVLDPREWVRAFLGRACIFVYPAATRRAQAAALLDDFKRQAVTLLLQGNCQALRNLINNTERQLRELTTPLPVRTFHDELIEWEGKLGNDEFGWSQLEIAYLEQQVGGSSIDRILDASIDYILLSTRRIDREELRHKAKPDWQPEDEWQEGADYRAMRRAHESARARERERRAESVVRVSAGPARLIGRPA